MRSPGKNSTSRICIGLPSIAGDCHEFGKMLLDVLSDVGFMPTLVEDGSRIALEYDVLLLVGDCHSFNRFAELLSKNSESNPKTVLWQIDPLPPLNFSAHAEKIGAKAFLSLERWRRSWRCKVLNAFLTRVMRRKLKQAVYTHIFRDFKEEIAKSLLLPFNNLDEESCKFMIRGYLWLKQNFSQDWLDYIFCTIPARKEFLLSRGIAAHYAPLGYHPIMGENLNLNRDIDVLFFGNTKNSRRQAIFANITTKMKSKGINLYNPARNCFGIERTKLLNQTRISLNVPMFPWEVAGLRFLVSMACGALVISEPIEKPAPYKPGIHFVQAGVADMPDVIEYYLNHPKESQAIVDTAYNYVTRELTLKNSIKKILREVLGHEDVESTTKTYQGF